MAFRINFRHVPTECSPLRNLCLLPPTERVVGGGDAVFASPCSDAAATALRRVQ